MSDISPSAIKTSSELERAVANAQTAEEVKALLHAAAISQQIVQPDYYDPNVLLATEKASAAAPAPQKYTQVVVCDGKKIFLEADSYDALQQKVEATYRELLAQPATQQQPSPLRDEHGRFTDAEQAELARRTERELRFKRGEISTAQYLEESGAVSEYLAKQGVDMEVLRYTTEQQQSASFEKSWQQATQEFLQSPAGRAWPGGEQNKNILGHLVQQLGLMDRPSAESLAAAFEYAKENGLLVENEEAKALDEIASATDHESLREAAHRAAGPSFFGR